MSTAPTSQTIAHRPIPIQRETHMRKAAELMLHARRHLRPLPELPMELRPVNIDEAYALQDIIAEAMLQTGGWKVGASAPDATPVSSPMPLFGGFGKSGEVASAHMRRLRGIEGEIAFLMGKDLPAHEAPYSREQVIAAIASAHPAIELLESAFYDPDKVDRFSTLGDLASNGGFFHGAAIPDWQQIDLTKESIVVTVDGAVRFEGTASNTAGTDLIRLVEWLANVGSLNHGGLRKGQWVTTGSWSGKTHVDAGGSALVEFANFGDVAIRFE
ncbi:2-keto-4-pentenoate hydratase [Silvibacterium acidisoli]|uniref:2-keto-4-pentenoate hydratase n=1 Tax=Acidobacteriaceae bacterium ZG23-2 TaxID=2883246 RepID=UPI00406BE7D5